MIELFIIFKTIIYTDLIKVNNNRVIIVLLTSLITLSFIYVILSLKTNKKYLLVFLFYTVFSIILFANAMYFSYFNRLISLDVFKQVGLVGDVKESIQELISFKKLALLLDIPIIGIYLWLLKKKKISYKVFKISENRAKKLIKTSVLMVVILFVYMFSKG
ncbi:MAG: hypothetical protein H5T96_04910 [Tissierellales bacterium]|nr:hypothetical protein [Tissierellales bacterium]